MKRRLMWFAMTLVGSLLALLAVAMPAAADGIIIPQPPIDRPTLPWRNIPISVKYHHVDVTIKDQVATTHVDQVFVNNAGFAVEGTYMFPLPEDAAISSFDMTVDGQKYEGKLLGREEARAIYEDIVRKQRDPALLEYVGRGAFQARIFPIPPGGQRRIELTYTQVLPQQGGLVHYRYPLNTEKFSSQPLQDVAITVKVQDRAPLRAVYSPSHPVSVQREGDRAATVGYEAQNVRPDKDFDLYYSVSQDEIAVNLLSYKASGEDGAFLLLVTPPIQADTVQVAKDVVFVMDVSGSMEGQKLDQAKAAANYVLDHLGPDDRFNIVSFSTATRLFASNPQPLSRRDAGKSFIGDLKASGSTDINRALLEAFAGADKERPTVVIFLTDGLPTAGETNADRIVANATAAAAKSVRLFTFGVGPDVDTVLLDQLAAGLRGTSAYVKPGQAIDEEVSAFYSQVSAPVLVDVSLDFGGAQVDDMYPYPLPDLFAGSQLIVAGRYRAPGALTLTLRGTVNGKPQTYTYRDLSFADRGGDDFIPRLWAQRKIGYLLAQIRLNGANNELVKEVVDLSTRYGIVTPYTSFLVQEPQQALTDQGRQALSSALQAPAAPAGQAGTGGPAAAATSAPAAAAPMMPQDRTGAAAVQRSEAEKALQNAGGSYGAAPSGAVAAAPVAAAGPGQVQQVGDKSFVLDGGAWIDTSYDQNKIGAETISFGSNRYFQLLTEYPQIGPYLALGDRVTVVLDGQAYAIGPAGQTAAQPGAATGVPAPVPTAVSPGATAPNAPALSTPASAGTAIAALSPATSVAVVERPAQAPPAAAPAAPLGQGIPGVCGSAAGAGLLGLLGILLALRARR